VKLESRSWKPRRGGSATLATQAFQACQWVSVNCLHGVSVAFRLVLEGVAQVIPEVGARCLRSSNDRWGRLLDLGVSWLDHPLAPERS